MPPRVLARIYFRNVSSNFSEFFRNFMEKLVKIFKKFIWEFLQKGFQGFLYKFLREFFQNFSYKSSSEDFLKHCSEEPSFNTPWFVHAISSKLFITLFQGLLRNINLWFILEYLTVSENNRKVCLKLCSKSSSEDFSRNSP